VIRRAALVLLAALGPAPLAAQGLYYEGGLSLASGTYIFAERTTSWGISSGLAATSGPVTLRASVPVYFQNTTLVSLSGPGGGIPTGGSSSDAVADSMAARKGREDDGGGQGQGGMPLMPGLSTVEVPGSAATGYTTAVGDPMAQLAWRALGGSSTALTVSALAKVPVADTATFGTGEWDVGAGISASQRVGRAILVGMDVTYWRIGDMETLDFRDPVSGTASFAYLGQNNWGGGLSVTASSPTLDGYDGPAWVSGFLQRSSGARWGLSASVGLTETTSDFSLGLSWRIRLLPSG
jgi:hypothetical protein